MAERPLSRREFLTLIGAGSAALAATRFGGPAFAADAARKPNVLLIVADDLGYADLGCHGSKEVRTPSIDSIAKHGVRFTSGYVSCPCCSPTRAGLLTGRYQQRFGHELNPKPPGQVEENFGLPLTETTIASRMRAGGYATGLIGKWHLGYRDGYKPLQRGFDEFFGHLAGAHNYLPGLNETRGPILRGDQPVEEKEYLTDAFAREAVAFIDKHHDKPFFLEMAFNAVHSPMHATDKYLERFPDIQDQKRRKFAAMLSAMDDAIGRIMAALRKNDIEKDTLVFFISDNGGPTNDNTSLNDPLRGGKFTTWEGGIRVPFMAQWKGHLPEGVTSDKPMISLDIVPTALAAAGIAAPDAKFDGVNILPYIDGSNSRTPHETLYWRYGIQSAIRKGNWKILRLGQKQPWELYDLSADIGEKANLADKQPDKLKELAADYDKWNAELVPPLWGPKALLAPDEAATKQPAGQADNKPK